MMQVNVKLFASLRDPYPEIPIGRPMSVSLSDNATLADLIDSLNLPNVKIIFVNGVAHSDRQPPLHDLDDIAVFPPLAGG